MAGDYASRMETLVKKNNPGWKPGDAFDTSILDQMDDTLGGLDFKVQMQVREIQQVAWLEYNLSLIPESIEKLKAAQSARGCKVLSVTDTINGYDGKRQMRIQTNKDRRDTEVKSLQFVLNL